MGSHALTEVLKMADSLIVEFNGFRIEVESIERAKALVKSLKEGTIVTISLGGKIGIKFSQRDYGAFMDHFCSR